MGLIYWITDDAEAEPGAVVLHIDLVFDRRRHPRVLGDGYAVDCWLVIWVFFLPCLASLMRSTIRHKSPATQPLYSTRVNRNKSIQVCASIYPWFKNLRDANLFLLRRSLCIPAALRKAHRRFRPGWLGKQPLRRKTSPSLCYSIVAAIRWRHCRQRTNDLRPDPRYSGRPAFRKPSAHRSKSSGRRIGNRSLRLEMRSSGVS